MTEPILRASIVLPLVLSLLASDTSAKPAPKGRKPAAAAPASTASPTQQLMPYINHLDQLLALHREVGPKLAPLINRAPGHLAVLKAAYAARRAKVEEAQAATLTAAIATCDALTSALDERQKTLGQIKANSEVKGSGDLGRRRKDNFSQGTVGPERTRTADVKEQARRERAHNREMQKRAAQADDAMTAGAVNRWNERSIALRQQITAIYARIGQG